MTDRGRAALRTTPDSFTVGPSSLTWVGGRLIIDINEIGAPPMIAPVKGRITVTPAALTSVEMPLTEDGTHIWRPFAPISDIDVDLNGRGWQWSGHGYFDANFGTRALEADFSDWTWGRFPTNGGETASCIYDAQRRDGTHLEAAIGFDRAGGARVIDAPGRTRFRRSLWQVRRETRADPGYIAETDTKYARCAVLFAVGYPDKAQR